VADGPRPKLPWFLVAASVLLTLLLVYTLFFGYLPSKNRITRLERELRDLYAREADLQTKLAAQEQRHAVRERQLSAATAERDLLARRLEDLERELAVLRGSRRR
jgi:hypothetical protein